MTSNGHHPSTDTDKQLMTTQIRNWIIEELTTSRFTTAGTYTRLTAHDGDGGQIITRARLFTIDGNDLVYEIPLWPGDIDEVKDELTSGIGIGSMDEPPPEAA